MAGAVAAMSSADRQGQFAVAVKLSTLLIAPVDAENGTVRYIVCATGDP
jgi:hypothetical protein